MRKYHGAELPSNQIEGEDDVMGETEILKLCFDVLDDVKARIIALSTYLISEGIGEY